MCKYTHKTARQVAKYSMPRKKMSSKYQVCKTEIQGCPKSIYKYQKPKPGALTLRGTNSACSNIAVYLLSIDPSIVGEVLSQVLIRDYVFV